LAYVSQVFSGKTNLSLEQASLLAGHLSFDLEQREYFFDLLSLERAGNQELKDFYKQKIDTKQQEKLNITKRFNKSDSLSEEFHFEYYSHWAYAAIHVITSLEGFQTVSDICLKLTLKRSYTLKVLNSLETWGLVTRNGDKYQITSKSIHLKDTSPWLKTHHQNLRYKAIQSINESNTNNLHYSSICGISKSSRKKIQKLLLESIESTRSEIRNSTKESELMGINLDFYEV
jgi:uncharacterized protein (TIGR02147 family)